MVTKNGPNTLHLNENLETKFNTPHFKKFSIPEVYRNE